LLPYSGIHYCYCLVRDTVTRLTLMKQNIDRSHWMMKMKPREKMTELHTTRQASKMLTCCMIWCNVDTEINWSGLLLECLKPRCMLVRSIKSLKSFRSLRLVRTRLKEPRHLPGETRRHMKFSDCTTTRTSLKQAATNVKYSKLL
jgi:hypothetical protein